MPQCPECPFFTVCPDKFGSLLCKVRKRPGDIREPLNEPSVIRGETQEGSHVRNVTWPGPVTDYLYFTRIGFYPISGNDESQVQDLFGKEVALGRF